MKLSEAEQQIAEQYCHGLTDKEVSEAISKPVWTVRTHKKHIYNKLGISTTHELVLYMVAKYLGHPWNLSEVHKKGLSAIMCFIMIFNIYITLDNSVLADDDEFCRLSRGRARTETRARVRTRTRGKRENEF